jgi:hypothetical protein
MFGRRLNQIKNLYSSGKIDLAYEYAFELADHCHEKEVRGMYLYKEIIEYIFAYMKGEDIASKSDDLLLTFVFLCNNQYVGRAYVHKYLSYPHVTENME